MTRPLPHTQDTWFTLDAEISTGPNLNFNISDHSSTVTHILCVFLKELTYCTVDVWCSRSKTFFLIKALFSYPQASDTVSVSSSTERLMQVSKTPKQHLPSGSQALIQWAEEQGYSPVTSYTSTLVANIFNIRLREPGKCKMSSTLFTLYLVWGSVFTWIMLKLQVTMQHVRDAF